MASPFIKQGKPKLSWTKLIPYMLVGFVAAIVIVQLYVMVGGGLANNSGKENNQNHRLSPRSPGDRGEAKREESDTRSLVGATGAGRTFPKAVKSVPHSEGEDPWKGELTTYHTTTLQTVKPPPTGSSSNVRDKPDPRGSLPESRRDSRPTETKRSTGFLQKYIRYSTVPAEKENDMRTSLRKNLEGAPPMTQPHSATASSSSLTDFVATGGKFPVLVLACDRANLLHRSLLSLLGTRGMDPSRIVVVIDGVHTDTEKVVQDLDVPYHVHVRSTAEMDKEDRLMKMGANKKENRLALRIASGYFYAISYALETKFTDSPGVVIVEDDMLYAPDFYEYFHAAALAIDIDPTLWLASAWNDNGFRNQVRYIEGLQRTDYFPGLGWLLPRVLWEQELRSNWPTKHWDHWLRTSNTHKGRDVLHPEVPRDYHAGIKGSFMDSKTHKLYFKYVSMADDTDFSWFSEDGIKSMLNMINPSFERLWEEEIKGARMIRKLDELEDVSDETVKLFYRSRLVPNTEFKPISGVFGIWHEPQRSSWNGVTAAYWKKNSKVLLLNTLAEYVSKVQPVGAVVFRDADFKRASLSSLEPHMFATASPPKVYSPLADPDEEAAALRGDDTQVGINGNHRHGKDLFKKNIRGANI